MKGLISLVFLVSGITCTIIFQFVYGHINEFGLSFLIKYMIPPLFTVFGLILLFLKSSHTGKAVKAIISGIAVLFLLFQITWMVFVGFQSLGTAMNQQEQSEAMDSLLGEE